MRPPRPWLGPWIARLPLPPLAAPMLGLGAPTALRRDFTRAVRQVPAAVLRARLRSIERVEAREALRAVTVPILVLSATRDRIVPACATRDLLRLRPDAQHVELPGPHLLLQREPVAAAGVVLGSVHSVIAAFFK